MMLVESRERLRNPADDSESAGAGRAGKLRVLVIAEACNPTWSSVPLVGYNMTKSIARRPELDVTVVTHVRNKAAVEADELSRLAQVHFINNDEIAGPAYRLGRLLRGGQSNGWTINTATAWPSYILFERKIKSLFHKEFENGEFDLIHRVTPVSPVMPSPLTQWTKIPVLIGPLNGGLPWPKDFPELQIREREWMLKFRELHRRLPYYKSTFRDAAGVICASEHTSSSVPEGKGKRFFMFENGVDPDRFPIATAWPEPRGDFRFITVGRLAAGKAIDITLRAMATSPMLRECKLTIVGDGSERAHLEAIIAEHEMGNFVELVGWLDQKEVAAKLRQSQAFVFPSLKEFGGGAVMEAMSAGLPSIVANYGGPGEIISPETGIRLPMAPRDEMIGSLKAAMEQFAVDHNLCRYMGATAIEQIRDQHVWARKAERMVGFYRETLGVPKA